jgi:hypothetical protein
MSNTASELGRCPFYGKVIPAEAAPVEYGIEGQSRVFAEYYDCDEPVQAR